MIFCAIGRFAGSCDQAKEIVSDNVKESVERLVKRSTLIVAKEVEASGTKSEIYKEFEKLEQKDKIPRLTPSRMNSYYAKKTLVES